MVLDIKSSLVKHRKRTLLKINKIIIFFKFSKKLSKGQNLFFENLIFKLKDYAETVLPTLSAAAKSIGVSAAPDRINVPFAFS